MFIRGTRNVNVLVVAKVEKPLSRKYLSPNEAPPKSVRLEPSWGRYRSDDKCQD